MTMSVNHEEAWVKASYLAHRQERFLNSYLRAAGIDPGQGSANSLWGFERLFTTLIVASGMRSRRLRP
jgi:hypothetical protein